MSFWTYCPDCDVSYPSRQSECPVCESPTIPSVDEALRKQALKDHAEGKSIPGNVYEEITRLETLIAKLDRIIHTDFYRDSGQKVTACSRHLRYYRASQERATKRVSDAKDSQPK